MQNVLINGPACEFLIRRMPHEFFSSCMGINKHDKNDGIEFGHVDGTIFVHVFRMAPFDALVKSSNWARGADNVMFAAHNMTWTLTMWPRHSVQAWNWIFTIDSRRVHVKTWFTNHLKLCARGRLFLLKRHYALDLIFTDFKLKIARAPRIHFLKMSNCACVKDVSITDLRLARLISRTSQVVKKEGAAMLKWQWFFEVGMEKAESCAVQAVNEFRKRVTDRGRHEVYMNIAIWHQQRHYFHMNENELSTACPLMSYDVKYNCLSVEVKWK